MIRSFVTYADNLHTFVTFVIIITVCTIGYLLFANVAGMIFITVAVIARAERLAAIVTEVVAVGVRAFYHDVVS